MTIKVGVSQLFYPLTMGRYMIEALEDRDDVELYTTGPFYDNWIPWAHGMTLDPKYTYHPTWPLPRLNQQIMPYAMTRNWIPQDEKFDVFIMIDAGFRFSTRPNADIVVQIKTDPHAIRPEDYDVGSRISDFVFTMQTPYRKPGEFYLPYAYSTKWHYPEEAEKEYDACLIGLLYDHRKLLIDQTRAKGMSVYYNIGEVYDEYRKRYAKSKLALSWSSLQDLPARVWEAFAMNIPLITNRVPDLPTFFAENEHYLAFSDVRDGVEKIEYAINNYDKALEMAHAACRKVRPHTWDARMQQVLETIKVI